MMKRHIASWVLLAVFVPMLLISSLHVHIYSAADEATCAKCVQHHCHGHLGQLTVSAHQCVLCQFLTLTFVTAVIIAAISYQPLSKILYAQRRQTTRLMSCGIICLRAPPAV